MLTIRSLDPLDDSAAESAMTSEEDAGLGALKTERGCLPLVALDVRAVGGSDVARDDATDFSQFARQAD